MPVTLLSVFLAALLTAVATGVGALPFLFAPAFSERTLGISNAAAAGLMVAASLVLIIEGTHVNILLTLLGILLGGAFIMISARFLNTQDDLHVGGLSAADAKKALMIVAVMTAHSFTEGVGVGVSFGGGAELGVFITAAIAVHNIPEGLAISLVLVPRGVSVWKAAGWSVFSSLPQPLMAVPAYLFVATFAPILPVGLGFAAGAMAWMTRTELLPDALRSAPKSRVWTTFTLAFLGMMAFQVLLKGV